MSGLHPAKKKRKVSLPLILVPDGQRVVQFYSKSKSDTDPVSIAGHVDWRRYISNFHPVPNRDIMYDGKNFPTIEHAFAYVKYKYSTSTGGTVPPSFVTDSALGNKKNIKAEHSCAGMKKYGFVMDVESFDRDKEQILRQLITERACVDQKFSDILVSIHSQRFYLLHFARGGGGGWGGYQSKQDNKFYGRNLLGKLMMDWASDSYNRLSGQSTSKEEDSKLKP